MSDDTRIALNLDNLAIDVFDVVGGEAMVESLTAGHGMPDLAGSSYWHSCSCVYDQPVKG